MTVSTIANNMQQSLSKAFSPNDDLVYTRAHVWYIGQLVCANYQYLISTSWWQSGMNNKINNDMLMVYFHPMPGCFRCRWTMDIALERRCVLTRMSSWRTSVTEESSTSWFANCSEFCSSSPWLPIDLFHWRCYSPAWEIVIAVDFGLRFLLRY